MNKIYIVSGHTGCYDDRNEWNVYAFTDEGKAKEYQNKLQDLANQIYSYIDDTLTYYYDINWEKNEKCLELLKLDNRASLMDYNGLTYHIDEVDLKE
jgi:hypothetical protein